MPSSMFTNRGMTLIDVVVGVAVMVFIFLAIFGAFRISIELVFSTKAKTGAVSLITERMENIRSLPYGSVGTVGGIPSGTIPQLEQVTLNGIPYTVRTLIQYTDAPEDGLDELDDNSITADYKTVKVEVLWSVKDSARSTFAVTRVSPAGLETLDDGGTLKVSVFNAEVNPVESASVRIVNNTTSPAIDVTASTNVNGTVSFPGAPEAGSYEVIVTKAGYSTEQTYSATGANPNPSPSHIAVIDETTTSISFFIDVLGSLRFFTWEPPTTESFADSFTDETKLLLTPNTTVSGGSLVLDEVSEGVYEASGTAQSEPVAPAPLVSWDAVNFSENIPANTSLSVQVYYHDGNEYLIVPDSDIPNNSVGFSSGPIDISELSIATYNTLQLRATLETTDTSVTPSLDDWSASFGIGPVPLPNVSFDIRGSKTIGTNGANPVYKYDDSFTTTSSGEWFIDDVEWDAYTVTLNSSYDVAEKCPNDISISPGEDLQPYYHLAPNTAHSLRVYVAHNAVPLPDATITVSGSAGVKNSSSCGQAYFGGLAETDYTVTISKPGFQTHQEVVSVSGDLSLLVGVVTE